MTRYQMLASVAALGTYLLIVAGAIVRVSGSGLGCPDWPTCHGQLVPPLDAAAIIEYTHRLLGALVSPLILATALGAWWARRDARGVVIPATLAPLLLVVQIALGAVVVALELPAMVVLVHLTFAMIILGLLVWTATAAGLPPRARRARLPRRLTALVHATATVVLLLVVVGAYVRATGAGYACVGFPDCNGQALPFGSNRLVDLHLTHRVLAYVVAILSGAVLWVAWRTGRDVPGVRPAATLLAVLVLVQIALGAIGVSSALPSWVRAAHVAGAAAVWSVSVVLACLVVGPSSRAVAVHNAARDPASEPSRRPAPTRPVPSA